MFLLLCRPQQTDGHQEEQHQGKTATHQLPEARAERRERGAARVAFAKSLLHHSRFKEEEK